MIQEMDWEEKKSITSYLYLECIDMTHAFQLQSSLPIICRLDVLRM